MWADFLAYYTGLNQERKKDEWTFQMEHGLLEEREDMGAKDEDSLDDEDIYDDFIPGVLIPEENYQERKEAKITGEWL